MPQGRPGPWHLDPTKGTNAKYPVKAFMQCQKKRISWMDWRIQPTDCCPCTSTLMCHHQQGICLLKIDFWPSMKLMTLVSACCYGSVSEKSGDYASLVKHQTLCQEKMMKCIVITQDTPGTAELVYAEVLSWFAIGVLDRLCH